MTEPEVRVPDLASHEGPPPSPPTSPIDGATRHTVRARRIRLTASAAALAAAVGVGDAVASGAFRDRTPVRATPAHPTGARHSLPPGPAWVETVNLTTSKGAPFTFDVRAAISAPGTSSPDPWDVTQRLVTVPQMGGYYLLTNTSSAAYDLGESVRLFAYWKVPSGACRRFDPGMVADIAANHIPVVQVGDGQELCPLAWGDSTLDTTPQTLRPHAPAAVTILPTTMGLLGQGYPLHLRRADAALYARVTATPPVGWIALDEELSTSPDHRIASRGLPSP